MAQDEAHLYQMGRRENKERKDEVLGKLANQKKNAQRLMEQFNVKETGVIRSRL